jgi:DtxR family transcriptional regulator, Mn-dependent transcriptional regulator
MNTHLENYLKGIYTLSLKAEGPVSTNALAGLLEMKASSVTDMLKKLDEKGFVRHTRYQGADLTARGRRIAIEVIRKHRLWEMFLVEKLGYTWDEVHEIAEQLEHVQSETLVDRLDAFLGYPTHDPHGDPIPTRDGKITSLNLIALSELGLKKKAVVRGVGDHTAAFLRHLSKLGLEPGNKFQLEERLEYDHTCMLILLPSRRPVQVSAATASHLLVQPL